MVSVCNANPWLQVLSGVGEACGDTKLDALYCVAGGWVGGNAAADGFINSVDMMMKQRLANRLLHEKSLHC